MNIVTTPVDVFFSNLISVSMEQKQVSLSPHVEEYVIELVSGLSSAAHTMSTRPAFINDLLRKGLSSGGSMRIEYLRLTGDVALFISGIFPDSLDSRRVFFTLGDFIDIGQTAYGNMNIGTFDELAAEFPKVVEALNAVSVEIKLTCGGLESYTTRRRLVDGRITRRSDG